MKQVLIFSLFALSAAVQADNFSWHGYVSQGITQSKDSNFITDNNDITLNLTEVGVNARWELKPTLALVGQANYLDGGNRYKSGGRIDYLFFDWKLPTVASWDTRLNIGRFKNRHWLYSATRDVPHTRATAVLPQSVYSDGSRDIALGSDGISLQSTRSAAHGSWEVNWSYGKSPLNQGEIGAFLGAGALGEAEQDFVHQFSVYYQPPSLNWRVGASWLSSDFSYTAAEVDNFFDGQRSVDRLMLSAIYFSEFWELSAEIVRDERRDAGAYFPDFRNERTSEGGYIQARYLFTPRLSGLVSLDTYTLNRDDPDGEGLNQISAGLIPAYYGYQDTLALGMRWDFATNWRLQAEHHWVEGAARSTGIILPQTATQTEKYWRMWSVQLMYWF
ncbi:hypothetical protein IT774_16975 [Salinimonas marina]|uniref:Uncharacterized protein n=1 Tax=Salinimonas marina TaxID=2785918 RepID=A0A7S9DXJ5_9ALTE|nr:hypothetical protein [Salinimonas marina]QPG05723.1 hypothetical protein IT774_16975 [Salinimonas marina]